MKIISWTKEDSGRAFVAMAVEAKKYSSAFFDSDFIRLNLSKLNE